METKCSSLESMELAGDKATVATAKAIHGGGGEEVEGGASTSICQDRPAGICAAVNSRAKVAGDQGVLSQRSR